MLAKLVVFVSEPNPSLNTLLPSPGAWPYSASDSPLNNAHNSGSRLENTHSIAVNVLCVVYECPNVPFTKSVTHSLSSVSLLFSLIYCFSCCIIQ